MGLPKLDALLARGSLNNRRLWACSKSDGRRESLKLVEPPSLGLKWSKLASPSTHRLTSPCHGQVCTTCAHSSLSDCRFETHLANLIANTLIMIQHGSTRASRILESTPIVGRRQLREARQCPPAHLESQHLPLMHIPAVELHPDIDRRGVAVAVT